MSKGNYFFWNNHSWAVFFYRMYKNSKMFYQINEEDAEIIAFHIGIGMNREVGSFDIVV